jgi:hypothetical protein
MCMIGLKTVVALVFLFRSAGDNVFMSGVECEAAIDILLVDGR